MMLRLRKFFIVIVWSHMTLREGGRFAFISTFDKPFRITTESGVYTPVKKDLLYTIDLPLSDRHVKLS